MPRKKKIKDQFEGHPFGVILAGEDFMYFADTRDLILGADGSAQGLIWSCDGEIYEYHGLGFLIRHNPNMQLSYEAEKSCDNEIV